MSNPLTKYAIGMFLWRREANLVLILNEIINYHPKCLYLYFDGPRNDDDVLEIDRVVKKCKQLLLEVPFSVVYNLAPSHMGLNKRFREGLKHIFSLEPAAIILEDDTVPSPSFFDFCSFYLTEYEKREDIVALNGFFKARSEFLATYKLEGPFTNYIFNPWGWASWSNKLLPMYNPDLTTVNWLETFKVFMLWWNFDLYRLRRKLLRQVETGELHTWDVQLQWSIFLAHKKILTSPINLISNVGNDDLATTFVAGSSDFEQEIAVFQSNIFDNKVIHLPEYDIELCRSKSNYNYFKKFLRKIKDKL